MGLQSYEASFRNIREGVFCEHYEMKWSNEWSPSGGQGRWIAADNWIYNKNKKNIHANEKKSHYNVESLKKMGYTTVEREDINDVDSI